MSSIDERIVDMKFNNKQFQRGVQETNQSLGNLKKGLNLSTATKNIQDLQAVGNRFSLAGMAQSVQNMSAGFVALGVIGTTALVNLTNKAIHAGTQLVKAFTIDPVQGGLREYETQMNAIQTILANTSAAGTDLKDVTKALDELNRYADMTIYNFTEMTRNIGTFTAAGVSLETSTEAIKGIANLAAVSGSNSQQASTAMYQLSQAISTGTVKLMDWNSVVNAGMGGKVFQDALVETAKVHGISIDSIIKKNGSFRESLSTGWLTADVLTDTLAKFTGDLSAEQLKQKGYNEQQIKDIQKLGQTANDAATKVKTMTQLMDTLKEATESGWAQTWGIIFGDFEEAKALFTSVSDTLGEMIGRSSDARNNMLQGWKDLGGRDSLIAGIANAFKALMGVLGPIRQAFRDIFPPMTSEKLLAITQAFESFTAKLIPGEKTMTNIRRTFRGVFAVLGIGWEIVKGLAGMFFRLFGAASSGAGGVLSFTASLGDWLYKVHQAIKNGDGLTNVFKVLGGILEVPVRLIQALGSSIAAFFEGFSLSSKASDGFAAASDRLKDRMEPLVKVGSRVSSVFEGLGRIFKALWEFVSPLANAIGDLLSGLGDGIVSSLENADYSKALDALNVGLFAGLVYLVKKFLSDGLKLDFGQGGVFESISGVFEGLTGHLEAMQQNLKANTLLKIAAALALLTASAVALSLIDSADLTKALTALTVMFTQLAVALKAIVATTTGVQVHKLVFVSASLILLSTAILLLTASVTVLSRLNWKELAKGLAGVVGIIGAVILASKGLAGGSKSLATTSLGLIIFAAALRAMAEAVKTFGAIESDILIQGLATVGIMMAGIAAFTHLVGEPKRLMATATGILILSVALSGLAKAVVAFGDMDWKTIGRGLAGVAGSLLAVAAGMYLMPPNLILTATGLLILVQALEPLSEALKSMAEMTWAEIGRGMATLAGALLIIAGAMYLMTSALPGAAALLVVTYALKQMVPVLKNFSSLSWKEILTGLGKLAATLGIIAALGIVVSLPILALGAAMVVLGVGTLAAGAGLLMIAAALTALSIAGAAGAAALKLVLTSVASTMPAVMQAFGEGAIKMITAFAKGLGEGAPTIINAFVDIVMAALQGIQKLVPELAKTAVTMATSFAEELARNAFRLGKAAIAFFAELLKGMNNGTKLDELMDQGALFLVKIIQGFERNLTIIIEAAFEFILTFLSGMAAAIEKYIPKIRDMGLKIAWELVDGALFGLPGDFAKAIGLDKAFNALTGKGGYAWSAGAFAMDGLAGGIDSRSAIAEAAARRAALRVAGALGGALRLGSPSRLTMEYGVWFDEGLALGIRKGSHIAEKQAGQLGSASTESLRKSLSGIGEVMSMDFSGEPVVRPVVDLTDVRKGALDMQALMDQHPTIGTEEVYSRAASLSRAQQATASARANAAEGLGGAAKEPSAPIQFIQNNNSPKALSNIEIYRQTNNQLSAAKGALGI